ncbi:ribosome recycling factor [Candidatus Karelsulcia muelleri]|uniref:ribosome-recycling factor n=1 Tax=Candidatus Karelsulcia muelleri TaxID=336810 RepID=UPI002364A123|nr:ribosome-recycling factor [Candidatus Karelsulcia muelleri]WDE42163.1 ribosome recycling factor [Candidatus Karelsulcia muelleri]WDR79152.1 ribosome recycling factor [Candidatus Karelsulcia muelleri]
MLIQNQKKELLLKQMKDRMNKILNYFKKFVSKIRIGKANTDILDDLTVEYSDKKINLYHIASITVNNRNTILIKPWEANILPLIEKSILKSKIGLVTINTGKILKIVLPNLTEERRKEILRINNIKLEKAKIRLRNIRKEYNKIIKLNIIDIDTFNRYKKHINTVTREYICLIENIFNKKNKEIIKI